MFKRKFTVREIALTGVLAALVFAASLMKIPIPTVIGNTRLHLGNVMCLLSGFLLGPVAGGFAAGIGSVFYDLTDPIYISSAPFTFIFKFAMAFLCGVIAWSKGSMGANWKKNIIAACSGALLYVILYLGKNFVSSYFFARMELQTVMLDITAKGVVSCVNGIIAAVVSVPLAAAVQKGLSRTGFAGGIHNA